MSPSDDETPRPPEIPDEMSLLEADLRRLGDALDVPAPPPEDVARAVRARIEREAVTPATPVRPARPPWLTRRRIAAGLAILIAVLLGATPQGRAAVSSILRFAGVEINVTASPSPTPPVSPYPFRTSSLGAPVPALPGERTVSLDEARRILPIVIPSVLGPPHEVHVADGGRVVSLFWPGLRLDEFDGTLDVVFRKDIGPPWPEQVSSPPGWWVQQPHSITYIPAGGRREIPLGVAGPTLIWQHRGLGLRLEGTRDVAEAVRIANSVR